MGPEGLHFWQTSGDAADSKTSFESHVGLNAVAAAAIELLLPLAGNKKKKQLPSWVVLLPKQDQTANAPDFPCFSKMFKLCFGL